MKMLLTLIALLPLAASAAPSKRYLVAFREGTTPAQREAALKQLGAAKADDLSEIGALVAEVPEERMFSTFADRASALPDVLEVAEDVHRNWLLDSRPLYMAAPFPSLAEVMANLPKVVAPPARPVFPLPAGVDAAEVPWGISRVGAAAAWAVTKGEGVKVAVIDTGIDCSHPDLAANCAGGYNALDSKKPWTDDNEHGTHVAGTIAGVLDGKGVVGVAPKARLYAVKVLDKDGAGGLTSIIKGLIWAGKNKMDVANMSLGAPMGTIFMRAALKYAQMNGVAVFAAAGNDGGSVNYPGAYPEAICVSALAPNETIAKFSSRGNQVAFIAPGVDVKSTIPGGKYDDFSGTSMATPHMAGLGALAVARGARGEAAVRAALRRAATPVAGLSASEQGYGVVDAAKLVR
ncbi:MAG: S8 family peptidase [Elusimicrobiota bacterium]|nr:MAG: S8 family peptidase [Elusimicrobiota bacterium]